MFTSPFTTQAKWSSSETGDAAPLDSVNNSYFLKIIILVSIFLNGLQGCFLFKSQHGNTTCTDADPTQTPLALVQVALMTRRKRRRSAQPSVPCDKDQVKPDSRGEDSSDEDAGEGPSKDDKGKAPAPAKEEESDTEIIIKSFSMKDLRNIRKDFSHNDGQTLVSWLLRCWDNGAGCMELDGAEARHLGNLSKEAGIDKALGEKSQTLSLWRRLISAESIEDGKLLYGVLLDELMKLLKEKVNQVNLQRLSTIAEIKQAKRLKPMWYGEQWLKYKYGEAWHIDYITLPQTRQGKRYVLTMVEVNIRWLETYALPHATARNTILGLEKQVL
ncbi:hypothetical protein llap_14435 [Limosa lapponica baueri]|uniref:Ubiquitin carboxyl-terminal hydrolase 4 n=1 Tax=Limosa lapponica baueri TaxID=1758121 RepID=A0A2I0TN92_LIMLA|nr:hypothetical protein llap_14435 [Limosa lapponica baueri]